MSRAPKTHRHRLRIFGVLPAHRASHLAASVVVAATVVLGVPFSRSQGIPGLSQRVFIEMKVSQAGAAFGALGTGIPVIVEVAGDETLDVSLSGFNVEGDSMLDSDVFGFRRF